MTAWISLDLPTFLQMPRNMSQRHQTLFPRRTSSHAHQTGKRVWLARLPPPLIADFARKSAIKTNCSCAPIPTLLHSGHQIWGYVKAMYAWILNSHWWCAVAPFSKWYSSAVGTMGLWPYTMCSFITPILIALCCSSRTDELRCSAGTDGAEMDKFFC